MFADLNEQKANVENVADLFVFVDIGTFFLTRILGNFRRMEFVDLCSGIGGLRLALESLQGNHRCVFACETKADARRNLCIMTCRYTQERSSAGSTDVTLCLPCIAHKSNCLPLN